MSMAGPHIDGPVYENYEGMKAFMLLRNILFAQITAKV